MSNTWEYRFAFRINGPADVPSEFLHTYEGLVMSEGPPLFGLFTPAVERSGILTSRWLPPRMILAFRSSLAALSLESRSNQISTYKLKLENFLGCGFANFLLNTWITLYPGDSSDKLEISFPSQAFGHHQELLRFVLKWSQGANEVPLDCQMCPRQSILGLPPKFSDFLENYPETDRVFEFFFQPATELRKDRDGRWANLFLAVNRRGIVILSDRYRDHASEYGSEMAFFPLGRVKSVDWIEPPAGNIAAIRADLQGAEVALRLSWSVFSGLRPYGERWSREVRSLLRKIK